MRANTFLIGFFFLLGTGCVNPGDLSGQAANQGLKGFQPAAPYASPCNPVCNPVNGSCSVDCMLTCNSGSFDCDNDITNGCECAGGAGQCATAGCNGSSCELTSPKPVGTNCSKDCIMNPACNATGECTGDVAPKGTFCANPPGGCGLSGVCGATGACECEQDTTQVRPDMSADTGGGQGVGGCSLAPSPVSGALVPLLLGLALLVLARLRPRRQRARK